MPECTENPQFVDCDGQPLETELNAAGDEVIVMCQSTSPNLTEWDSSVIVSPPLPCTEGLYRDTNENCLSHWCIDGTLYEFCGDSGGGGGPGLTQICYDLANLTFSETCFGGAGTFWTVDNTDLFDPPCAGQTSNGFNVADPEEVFVNANYTTITPPGPGQLATLLGGAQDTNQGTGFSTTAEVSGSPSIAPWFGAQQPLTFIQFQWPPGAYLLQSAGVGLVQFNTGPNTQANSQPLSGEFGVAFWDSTTDEFVPIGFAGSAGGAASISIETLPGMGDWLRIDGQSFPAGLGKFTVELSPPSQISSEGVYMVVTGLGQGSSVDQISQIQFDYGFSTTAECCDCYTRDGNAVGSLAAAMTSNDPNGVTWTNTGTAICGDVPDGSVGDYGALGVCDGGELNQTVDNSGVVIEPNGNNQAPVIVTGTQFTVPENQTSAFTVGATDDADTGNLFYEIQGGPDANRFTIDNTSGVVQFIAAPDYEVPVDDNTDNTYEVIVSARDTQGVRTSQIVTVAVTDVTETVCQPVDPNLLDINVVPGDSNSDHGPNRTDGQWLAGGDRLNANFDNLGNILSPPLAMLSSGEIDGPFVLENGDSRVLWTEPAVDGVLSIKGAMQYVKDGSYQPPPAGGGEGLVNSPPSHRLFFDGTRNEISFIATPLSIGPSGDQIKYATSFIVEGWMFADDFTTAIYEHHVPVGQSGTSPVGTTIRSGQLIVFSQFSTTPQTPGGNTNSTTTAIQLGAVNLPPPGTRVSLIYDYKIDPSGSGYFRLYQLLGGTCQVVVSHDHQFGFYYTDATVNDACYPQLLKIYNFHQFVNSGQATENWDDTGAGTDNSGGAVTWNNTRELHTAYGALTTNNAVSVDDLCNHNNFYIDSQCGSGGGVGGIQGTPADQTVSSLTEAIDVLGDVAPTDPSDAVEWLYSTDGGATFTAFDAPAAFPVRAIAYVDCVFDGFDTLPAQPEWETYSGPGHNGYGTREPGQVTIGAGTDNPAQTSLFITGTANPPNGPRAGGVAHQENNRHTYGRWRLRMRADADPTQTFSALALLWNPDNGDNVVPLPGGEIDFVEMLAFNAVDRQNIAAFIHADDGAGNDNNFYVPFPSGLDGTQMREYTVERTPGAIDIYYNDGAGQVLVNKIEGAVTPIPHGPMHLTLQLDAFDNITPIYNGPDVQAEYEWIQVCRLVDQPILVKARLVSDPTQETPTGSITILGAADQIEFTVDLPDGLDRQASDFVNATVEWNQAASFQWQFRDSAGNTLWTDATGTGNSGFGSSSTYGADVVVTPGRYYRLVVTSGSNGDYWVSNDTFTNIIP